MIGNLSYKVAKKFINYSEKCYNEIAIYQYGFFVLFSNVIFFLLTMILGALYDVLFSSIVFYITFFSIRQYAGGYHAATETKCEIMTTLSILGCVTVIKLTKTYDFLNFFLIMSIISAFFIAVLCPLDTPEKPLSNQEFQYFRKISWTILLVINTVIAISYIFSLNTLLTPCCISLILEALLILAGKSKSIKNQKK